MRENGWTIPLAGLTGTELAAAGPKAATLGRLLRAGLPVPRGFVVTTAAFRNFMESAPRGKDLQRVLADAQTTAVLASRTASGWMNEALGNAPIPGAVAQALESALQEFPQVPRWAVRSSATAEDLAGASFAGQHDSFLNVPRAEVLDRVRQCWLSLFSPRAVLYRARQGVAHDGAAMAVIVQEMIPAEVAGVLFTADPSSSESERIVIEASRGLGDRVVNGRVTPERVVLAKTGSAILERVPGGPAHPGPGGAERPGETGVLDETTARRVAELSRQVQQLLPGQLDMEWAACHGEVYLLQARPITGRPAARSWEDRQVWTNLNTGEVAPDVVTPATWSIIRQFLDYLCRSVFRLVGADIRRASPIGLVAGRVYFNANTGLAALRPFGFLLKRIDRVAQALGGGQLEDYRQAPMNIPPADQPDLGFRWPKYVLSWPLILYDLLQHSPGRGDAWTERLKKRASELARVDVEAMALPQAAGCLAEFVEGGFEGWDLLYLGTQAAVLPLFQKACGDWLDDPDLALGYQLFSGLGGLPEAEAGLALWRLALLAHGDQATETVVRSEGSWAPTSVRLQQSEHGRRFLAAWEDFMREHGHHCRGELELFNPRWCETPDYILGLVRGYLGAIGRSDPLEQQKQLAQKRRDLTEACRRRLKHPLKRWLFLRVLGRAQRLAVNREEWKNQAVRQLFFLRRVLLRLGRLLCEQGTFVRADDVFFLEANELIQVVNRATPFNVSELIRARRQEYEANLAVKPPPVVVGRFRVASQSSPRPEPDSRMLAGIPVSPGTARGRARVILREDDDQRVLPGEILVAPFTDPAWTPYFVTAAGLVVDQGGILSHGSIVAREYGLPAVTNVGSATRVIRTGDLVEVDGTRGQVSILETAR